VFPGAVGLYRRGHTGRPKAHGGGDSAFDRVHGAIPPDAIPARSSRPNMMLRHWTAMPAVPPMRLSMALTMMRLPVRESWYQPMSQKLVALTYFTSGSVPGGRIRTKGSFR